MDPRNHLKVNRGLFKPRPTFTCHLIEVARSASASVTRHFRNCRTTFVTGLMCRNLKQFVHPASTSGCEGMWNKFLLKVSILLTGFFLTAVHYKTKPSVGDKEIHQESFSISGVDWQ